MASDAEGGTTAVLDGDVTAVLDAGISGDVDALLARGDPKDTVERLLKAQRRWGTVLHYMFLHYVGDCSGAVRKLCEFIRSHDTYEERLALWINQRNTLQAMNWGQTPLHVAASRTNFMYDLDETASLVETLLEFGADPWLKDGLGRAAIDRVDDKTSRLYGVLRAALRGDEETKEKED